uniref:Uncharacterized protein n=1 Tax=Anguilla anguilla TaxID=7936 RepID=A0A0E9UPR7_ANGAN
MVYRKAIFFCFTGRHHM